MSGNDDTTLLFLEDNFEDFFEQALCGFLITGPKGIIRKVNQRMVNWTCLSVDEIKTKRFSDLLTMGGKIYYETHLAPLLQMQGFFEEVALELRLPEKKHLKVLVNAQAKRNDSGNILFIRFMVLKASDRHRYEDNLRKARNEAQEVLSNALQVGTLREQFIAVLGHDLRNPLGAITAGATILQGSADESGKKIAEIIAKSAKRMTEMISNVLDFASARLGGGMVLTKEYCDLTPVLNQVIDELQVAFPDRKVNKHFNLPQPVNCDPNRIAQLFSNLLANAFTHGDSSSPIEINAGNGEEAFDLSVSNAGAAIPADHIARLFEPFTRESARPSQQGLGLGLYIASRIAQAHGGTLTASSTEDKTQFTLRLPPVTL